MKIKVKFYGMIKDLVRERETEIEVADSVKLRKIMEILIERYGDRFRERVLTDSGRLQSYVRMFVDDEPVEFWELDEKSVGKGDSELLIYILPAQMGGKNG